MIDKRGVRFLSSNDFGVLGARKPRIRWALSLLIPLAAMATGCRARPAPPTVEDSLTSGRISIVSSPEIAPLLERERSAFEKLYPQARLEIAASSSAAAVGCLFGARCDLAAVSRDLTPEERRAAVRGELELEGYRFAKDAVVVVVHPDNPVENMALDALRRIYEGEMVNWSELGGSPGAIQPVFPPVSSDMADFFVQHVMDGPVRARVVPASGDSEVVAAVRSRPGAVGFVSLAWADRGAKALRVSSLTGLPYWKPDLEAIYDGDYPLSRSLSFYVRASGPRLAQGFITFVTSRDGQQIVHESGLVPTAVPVRFVRRSGLRGAH